MSNTITIAEVAAKLGLERKGGGADWVGTICIDGSEPQRFTLFGSGPRLGCAEFYCDAWNWRDGAKNITFCTPEQVCELAGVDYERYEGREIEPQQAEIEHGVELEFLDAQQMLRDQYRRGIEAGRAEGATIRAELLDIAKESQYLFAYGVGSSNEFSGERCIQEARKTMDRIEAAIARAKNAQGAE